MKNVVNIWKTDGPITNIFYLTILIHFSHLLVERKESNYVVNIFGAMQYCAHLIKFEK